MGSGTVLHSQESSPGQCPPTSRAKSDVFNIPVTSGGEKVAPLPKRKTQRRGSGDGLGSMDCSMDIGALGTLDFDPQALSDTFGGAVGSSMPTPDAYEPAPMGGGGYGRLVEHSGGFGSGFGDLDTTFGPGHARNLDTGLTTAPRRP